MENCQKYEVGAQVRIIRVDDCAFGASTEMREMIGTIGTIVSAKWDGRWGAWDYRLAEDCGHWWWDDTCFEAVAFDLGEINAGEVDIFSDLIM